MKDMMHVLYVFCCLLHYAAVWGQKTCDFIKVYESYDNHKRIPDCAIPDGFLGGNLLHSLGQCFTMACHLNANVIHYEEEYECRIFTCKSNHHETDWEYNWIKEDKSDRNNTAVTYALPHDYSKRCYNSYFVRKMLDNGSSMKSGCYLLTRYRDVKRLDKCMMKACDDKANTFNFNSDGDIPCETLHCGWNRNLNDYDLKPLIEGKGNVSTYRLSHVSKPCNTLSWNDSVQLPFVQPSCQSTFSFKSTKAVDKNLEMFCTFGANTFQDQTKYLKHIIGSRCPSNKEGTNWEFSPQKYTSDLDPSTKWLNIPHPGNPNCRSSYIFKIISLKEQNQASNCGHSKTIQQARDLRQCMLYGCELGFNVINYRSSSKQDRKCELRNCSQIQPGTYDLNYVNSTDVDVYALQRHYKHEITVPTTTPQTHRNVTPETPNNVTPETQPHERSVGILVGVIVFLTIVIILLLLAFLFYMCKYPDTIGNIRTLCANGRQSEEARQTDNTKTEMDQISRQLQKNKKIADNSSEENTGGTVRRISPHILESDNKVDGATDSGKID
ncbi:unnamed protein product [Owenia fusiformis]|uniref:Uncharacterized protein n=1 Tax=Owenia fusiformis TaxID=6347 RepID=A0A8J1TKH1_OWEFU|nr:unnamed protein product [Owenia fusiformis]